MLIYISKAARIVIKTSKFLKGGSFNFWEIQFEKRICVIQKIPGQDAYLSIIGSERVNSGYIRLEMKKNIPTLSKLL